MLSIDRSRRSCDLHTSAAAFIPIRSYVARVIAVDNLTRRVFIIRSRVSRVGDRALLLLPCHVPRGPLWKSYVVFKRVFAAHSAFLLQTRSSTDRDKHFNLSLCASAVEIFCSALVYPMNKTRGKTIIRIKIRIPFDIINVIDLQVRY